MSYLIFPLIDLYHSMLSDIHLLLHFVLRCSIAVENLWLILDMNMFFSTISVIEMIAPTFALAMLMSCLNFFMSLSCGLNLYFLFSIFFNSSSITELAHLSSYGIVFSI